MKRAVFDIQRFCLNDGPGIRTTVFLKGCPLNCLWCHNPESKSVKRELIFRKRLCLGCGDCAKVCESGIHAFSDSGDHLIDRVRCLFCGSCVEACVGALEICGSEMSADEIIAEVIRDKTFYENSGGGITVSGGEPLMMPEFTKEILMKAKEQGIHTAIETSGFAPWQDIEGMLPFIDLFLFDIKESDDELHKKYTGVSLSLIRENLSRLNAAGARIILRVPIIPGYNDRDEHLREVGKLAEKYESVERVDVMPYHPLGKSKSEDIGKEYTVDISEFPSDDDVNRWISMISEETKKQVQKG